MAKNSSNPNPKIICIVGPTASGKSALAVWLAKRIQKGACGAEIISADSRQVYKGLDIGTGKVTKKETQGMPHHLLSVANPKKQFSVDDFVKQAERACFSILQKARIVIVVGGTGLYVDMFTGRMSYPNVAPNATLRAQLERLTTKQLFARLKKLDSRRAATIEKENPRRLVRAIEIAKALGKSPTPNPSPKYDVLWLGLNPTPAKLRANIHKRLLARISQGMVAEARRLHKQGLTYKRMDELGLEYRYLAQLLQGRLTQKEFIEQLEREINNYAKRQWRWFKRNKDIHWVGSKQEALSLAKAFLSR